MEVWSVGKAVLQGMGLEITRDILFFALLVVLFGGRQADAYSILIIYLNSQKTARFALVLQDIKQKHVGQTAL